jgi:beta-galactosidase/beta-glucuronidase
LPGLEHLALSWSVEADGMTIDSGSMPTPTIAPGRSKTVTLPFAGPANPQVGVEYWLTVRFTLIADTHWAEAGYEVAAAQFQLPVEPLAMAPAPVATLPPLRCACDSDTLIEIEGPDFEIAFDKVRGRLTWWAVGGVDLIQSGPRLNFFRAPIDNERMGGGGGRGDATVEVGSFRQAAAPHQERHLRAGERVGGEGDGRIAHRASGAEQRLRLHGRVYRLRQR